MAGETDENTGGTALSNAAAEGQPANEQAASAADEGGKPAEDQGTEEPKEPAKEPAKSEEKAKEGAPDKYTDFALPEGIDFSEGALKAVESVARELNLNQEQAQKIAEAVGKVGQLTAADADEQFEQVKTEWHDEAKADKEIGGQNWNTTMQHAGTFIRTFAEGTALRELFEATGVGNHPELIRVFARAGKALGDARVITGNARGGAQTRREERMFPTMVKTD